MRMDDFPARLVILLGSSEKLAVSGREVADADALAAVGRVLADAGVPFKARTVDELAARRVGGIDTARRSTSTPRSSGSGCGTRCGCLEILRQAPCTRRCGSGSWNWQCAAPLAGPGATARGAGREHLMIDNGVAGRRGPGAGPVRPARRAGIRDAGAARRTT